MVICIQSMQNVFPARAWGKVSQNLTVGQVIGVFPAREG